MNMFDIHLGIPEMKALWDDLKSKHDTPMPFGVVVTLKEMHGKNRINDFIQMCQLNGWIVNRIDIDNRIDIYNVAEEDVEFD